MSNPAQGPITLYAPKPVSMGTFPPSNRPKFQSKFKLIFSVLLSLGIGAGFYLLTDEVRGVITEGGSAVTLDRVLDETFNLSLAGYLEGTQLKSTATSGSPLSVLSSSLVTNLNADLLDGQHGSYYLNQASGGGWVDDGTAVRLATATDWVGIGDSTPDYPLDVEGNLGVSGDIFLNDNYPDIFFDTNDYLRYERGANEFHFRKDNLTYLNVGSASMSYGYGGPFLIVYQGGGVYVGNSPSNPGIDNLSVEGSVGIGTASPDYALDVVGDAAFSGDLLVNGTNIGTSVDSDLLALGNGLLTLAGSLTLSQAGPTLLVDGTNVSPAVAMLSSQEATAGNFVSGLYFRGRTDNPTPETAVYADILGAIDDPTSGSYVGNLRFNVGFSGGSTEIARFSGATGVILNEGGWDLNFRVEGNNDGNLIFGDAGLDYVGIGTASPLGKLHVQSGSPGAFTPHANADELVVAGAAKTGISIVAGGANAGYLIFGRSTNNVETILQSGDGSFSIARGGTSILYYDDTTDVVDWNAGELDIDFQVEGNTDVNLIYADAGLDKVGIGRVPTTNKLEVGGDASKSVAGDWLANSDIRIKTDVQTVRGALETIGRLRPVKFKYTDEYLAAHPEIKDQYYYNFIAQEFQEVFPDAVKQGGDGYLQVDAYVVRPYLVAAVQELAEKVEELESAIDGSGTLASDNPPVPAPKEEEQDGIFEKITAIILGTFEKLIAKTAEITSAVIEKLSAKVAEFGKLTVGGAEAPAGITIYDQVTGEPYCVLIAEGEWVKELGECD